MDSETVSRTCPTNANERVYVSRYGTRNWAVTLDGELLAVVLYRKGARAIAATIVALLKQVSATREGGIATLLS